MRAHLVRLIALIAVTLCTSAIDNFGYAQAERPKMQTQDQYVDYDIRGRVFRVPEKYLGGWQTRKWPTVIKGDFFDVAFWLSDGKPSPVRGISLTTYWPKEPGRPTSGTSDFVVNALNVSYLPPEMAQSVNLPAQLMKNTLERTIYGEDRVATGIFGLTCYSITRPKAYHAACSPVSDSDIDVYLHTSWPKDGPDDRPINPHWQIDIYSKTDGLRIGALFPEVALNRWPDVVCRSLTLARSWLNPPSDSTMGCRSIRTAKSGGSGRLEVAAGPYPPNGGMKMLR